MNKAKSILITGATGLLGTTLVALLQEKGCRVHQFEGDICDIVALGRYRVLDHVDWIVHAAAMTDVKKCENNRSECFRVNVQGTRNIRDLARALHARILYISTVSVFSGAEGGYTEHDVPYPKNFYSLSKLLGEETILGYDGGAVLRLNIIGVHPAGSRGKNFFEWLVDSIQNNRDISLFTNVRVNPLSNWTIADCIIKYIECEPAERILHIGSRNILSKADVGRLVMKHANSYRGSVAYQSVDQVVPGVERSKEMWLDVTRAEQVLEVSFPTLESEIDKIISKNNIIL